MKDATHRPDLLLARLRIALEARLPVADDIRAWLCPALAEYEETGEALEHLLGLRGAGVRSVPTLRQTADRDILLELIYRELDGSPWRRCEHIARMLCGDGHCPAAVGAELRELLELDVYIPTTPRGIYGLLKRTSRVSFQ